jgi:hypothetical protein
MGKTALIGLLLVLGAAPLLAQSDADKLKDTVDNTVDIQKKTQERQDEWAKEEAELLARYRTAQANVKYLGERKANEEKKVLALEERIAELERRLEETTRLKNSLQDTLNVVYARLDDWVSRDLPFLIDERDARLVFLKNELARPDVSGAEKLRRVLETLQIEAMYGGTVEVTQDQIAIASDTLYVDVLRLGRVSIFWRTTDGKRVGEFDRAGNEWIELPGKYNRAIGDAMEMASRMRPVELIALPLGRIAQ